MPTGQHPSPAWSEDEAREYASLLDLANDAIIVMTLEGTIQFWNEGAVRLYGWRKPEAVGKCAHDLLKTEYPAPLEDIKLTVRRENEWSGDLVHTARNGRRILVASRWTPRYSRDGELVGTFEINRDVTREREAQEALIRAENVDRLATLGRLAASVAHEINNPLDTLRGVLHLLQTADKGTERSTLIATGIAEVQRAMDIVNGTLGFARDNRAVMPALLPQIMDGVLTMYAGRLRSHSITVHRRYTTAGQIICRPGEMRQVFANLVGNAVDAMRTVGGNMFVHIHHAVLAGTPGYRVTVSDEGVGISAAAQMRVFEPFYSTKGEMGTGLGLWISRSIVTKQGGSIRFRSRTQAPRKGTIFSVTMSAAQPATAPGEFQQNLGDPTKK
jgi:PAS domain S-box-containing protein